MTSNANAFDVRAERYADRLKADGYVIIPNAVPTDTISVMNADMSKRFKDTPFCVGPFYGNCTKRFGKLLTRSKVASQFVQHELILSIVRNILMPFADTIGLNLTQAIEIHPGAGAQVPHRDENMWGGPKGDIEYLVNVMWPLTDYRHDNGATILWPKSHSKGAGGIDSTPIEIAAGSAFVFLGSTLHGAGGNQSQEIRRGMIISYCLGWLKPYENQWLCYPPEVAKHFSPELADLVGYHTHRPNLGNYEGQCPSVLLGYEVPEHLGAIDCLRPDQEELIKSYLNGELKLAA